MTKWYSRIQPKITNAFFSEADNKHAFHIDMTLDRLTTHARNFEHALQLLDYSVGQSQALDKKDPAQDMYQSWRVIAARSAVLDIWHFGQIIEGLRATVNLSVTVGRIISPEFKNAGKRFETAFPAWRNVRHVAAHGAETVTPATKAEEHAIQGSEPVIINGLPLLSGGGKLQMSDMMIDRTYTGNWQGVVVTCDISQTNLELLIGIRDDFFDAFEKVIAWSRQQRAPKSNVGT